MQTGIWNGCFTKPSGDIPPFLFLCVLSVYDDDVVAMFAKIYFCARISCLYQFAYL